MRQWTQPGFVRPILEESVTCKVHGEDFIEKLVDAGRRITLTPRPAATPQPERSVPGPGLQLSPERQRRAVREREAVFLAGPLRRHLSLDHLEPVDIETATVSGR